MLRIVRNGVDLSANYLESSFEGPQPSAIESVYALPLIAPEIADFNLQYSSSFWWDWPWNWGQEDKKSEELPADSTQQKATPDPGQPSDVLSEYYFGSVSEKELFMILAVIAGFYFLMRFK